MRPCIPATSAPSATGRQSGELQKGLACPKARPNRSRHRFAAPPSARRATAPERIQAPFSLDRARPVSLLARPKGAPAAPRAVGRGGAREQAQFSPQAEPELSGLCDDDNGGCIPLDQPPAGAESPVAAGRRPKFPRAVCNLPYTLQGRPYHRAAEGGGPYGCTERIYPRASLRPSR